MRPGAPSLDHLVYGAPDLASGRARILECLGVEPEDGGRHERWGTHNALLGLGGQRYLEVIAPDPEAEAVRAPRPFGLDGLREPRLVSWAVRVSDPGTRRSRARNAGIDPGPVLEGSRRRPDGGLLRWRLTDPAAPRADGVIPFFIDWGESPHPSADLRHAVRLLHLRAEHPDPGRVGRVLAAVDVSLEVARGPRAILTALVEGPAGRIELR